MTMPEREPRTFLPVTPAGTVLVHLVASTEDAAWANLLKDAAHMPYKGRKGFEQRGYTVVEVTDA